MVSELKQLMARELAGRLGEVTDYVVVDYTGLKGQETTELRRRLREQAAHMEVVKNSIAERVLKDVGLGDGAVYLDGPSALVTGDIQMPALCRLISDLQKDYEEKFTVRGGLFDGAVLDAAAVERLASIPPMPVLQAQIIGSVYGQLASVAGALQAVSRSLACALEAIRNQKESAQ